MASIGADPRPAALLLLGLLASAIGPIGVGRRPAAATAPVAVIDPSIDPVLLAEGHFGGASLAVRADGDRIYVGEGPVVAVYRDRGGAELELLGRSEVLSGLVIGIEVSGDRVAVSHAESLPDPIDFGFDFGPRGGLSILDASDPARPRIAYRIPDLAALAIEMGWQESAGGEHGIYARRMAFDGPWLHLATDAGLMSLDLSDPDQPRPRSRYAPGGIAVLDFALRSPMLYANTVAGQRVIDVSDPGQPKDRGCLRLGFLEASQTMAALAGSRPGVDQQEPGCFDFFLEGARLHASDRRLALSWFGQTWIFDLKSPEDPEPLGMVFSSELVDLVFEADWLYGLDPGGGLFVLDPEEIDSFEGPLASLDLPGEGRDLEVRDARAFVATGAGGLRMVDLSLAERPREIGALIGAPHPRQVEVIGDLAYVVDPINGLQVFELREGAPPIKRSAYRMPRAEALRIDGNRAILLSESGEMRMLDLSLAARPRELGPLVLPRPVNGLLIAESLVFAGQRVPDLEADGRSRPVLAVFEWTGGDALQRAELDLARIGGILQLQREGDLLLALGPGGLALFDLARPTAPEPLGTYYLPRGHRAVNDMAVAGQHAFLALGESARMVVVDLSEPLNPVEVAVLPYDGGRYVDLRTDGRRIYAAELRPDLFSGRELVLSLVILDFTPGRGLRVVDRRPGPALSWQDRFIDDVVVGRPGASLARWRDRILLADPRSGIQVYRELSGRRLYLPSVQR